MITIKSDKKAQIEQEVLNRAAKEYLASTDWYVTRMHETGKEIPIDVASKRQEARDNLSKPLLTVGDVPEIKLNKTPLVFTPVKKDVMVT
jgi:hypothetical protein